MRIRDPESFDPGFWMVKIRIRDKHPGSATLDVSREKWVTKSDGWVGFSLRDEGQYREIDGKAHCTQS
jgi:hypothetical protein